MLASIRTIACLIAATAATTAFAAPAVTVGDATTPRSVEVRHGDLNLASATGEAALNRRIAAAATAVCGRADIRDLSARQRVDACRATTLAAARTRVEVAVAAAKSGTQFAVADTAVAKPHGH